MGRRIPDDNLSLSLIHPILYLSFLAAGLAASIAIITSLCSVLFFWKKPSPSPAVLSDPSEINKEFDASEEPLAEATATPNPQLSEESKSEDITDPGNSETQMKELPLPPAMQQPKDSYSYSSINMKRAASERKLSFNLSIKMPRTLSVVRNRDHKDDNNKKMKLKAEDSVWMKTIILGEKCQVPEDEGNAVIYEGKGKKVAAYHPKTKTSMSISRQSSFNDPDALQVQEEDLNET